MTRYQTLFVDAGNTLFHEVEPRASLYAHAARQRGLNVTDGEMAAMMATVHDQLPIEIEGAFRYSRGWFDLFMQEVFGRLRFRGDFDELRDSLFHLFDKPGTYTLFPEVRPVLKRLKGCGVPMGVISNWSPRLSPLLARLGLLSDFRGVIASATLRLEKPDPAIFHRAMRELEVEPEHAIHVGDDPLNDADAANRAGIRGILIDRVDRHPNHPDRITTFDDLLPLFDLPRLGG